MNIRKFVWLDKGDESFVSEVRAAGVRELARACDMSPALISRWLRGHTGMAYEKFTRICEEIGKPKDD